MAFGMLYNIDANFIVLTLLFVIFFVIIQFALSKSLKDKTSASIIALCASLLAIYGIYRGGFDLSGIFNNVGISEEIIYTVLPLVILAGLIYLFWKVRLGVVLGILGFIFIAGSRFVYEKATVLIVGIIVLVIGIFLMINKARRDRRREGNVVTLRGRVRR
jgi:hypothetical protein